MAKVEETRANKIKSIGDLAKAEIESHEKKSKVEYERECKKVSIKPILRVCLVEIRTLCSRWRRQFKVHLRRPSLIRLLPQRKACDSISGRQPHES